MSFDLTALRRVVAVHGPLARIVVADVQGSAPREVGAAMLVWGTAAAPGQSGTIGGGALEHQAVLAARSTPGDRVTRHPLGPALGQCCGGAVTLITEFFDDGRLNTLSADAPFARRLEDSTPMPWSLRQALKRAREEGIRPAPKFDAGWMLEPVCGPGRPLWIWGAGHVGRALVSVLSPLPEFALTWIDTGPERFPDACPDGVTLLPAAAPERLVPFAPPEADHLILTYSHSLDLALCHALLTRGFASAGLIGSATKWARFRSRLAALGHDPASIARITCPIGDPALGRAPQAIAIGVAATLLAPRRAAATREDRA